MGMLIEGRWKGALVLSVLWAAAVLALLYLVTELSMEALPFAALITSVAALACGIAVYLGAFRLVWVFNTLPEHEMSEYDAGKITSFMGAFLVLISYLFFLICILNATGNRDASLALFFIVFGAAFGAVLYVFGGKRFRTDQN